MDLKVTQLENKNQFVISDNDIYIFQSYDTIIAKYNRKDDVIYIDNYVYKGSRTTLKHLYIFLDRYCDVLLNSKRDLIDCLENEDNKSFILKLLNPNFIEWKMKLRT